MLVAETTARAAEVTSSDIPVARVRRLRPLIHFLSIKPPLNIRRRQLPVRGSSQSGNLPRPRSTHGCSIGDAAYEVYCEAKQEMEKSGDYRSR
jgi:hypothetical protein